MPMLSSFQTLPLLVVDLIVDYVVGGNRLQLARMSTGKLTTVRLLQPLLSVCHSFHAAVQPHIFNRYVLDLNTSDNQTGTLNPYQSVSNGPSAHLTAKALDINIDLISVSSGRALEKLSRAPYDSCIFPAVRSLTFNCILDLLSRQKESAKDPAMASANATAFLQRLRQMAPRAHKLVFSGRDAGDWPLHITHDFRPLVSELIPLVDHFESNTGLTYRSVIPNFDEVCNLVHIDCVLDVSTNAFYQLALQCAPSLRSLRLQQFYGFSEPMDISGLIHYPDGGYVEYPLLIKLEMQVHHDSVKRPTFAGAVPFPVLRDLRIVGFYPFGDDTLFRGNMATLERLHLVLSQYFVNHQNTPRILSLLAAHASIQILELTDIRLTLWDVIALIKSLPLLSELTTTEPRIGARPAGHSKARLPKYVIDHYPFAICSDL
ncbi:hypothetical protein GGF42_003662 [Coemansia sp. RSA 2424]|nr:hypothetical protein GGF42_003662 [Coemansia sp. RSA 2424]